MTAMDEHRGEEVRSTPFEKPVHPSRWRKRRNLKVEMNRARKDNQADERGGGIAIVDGIVTLRNRTTLQGNFAPVGRTIDFAQGSASYTLPTSLAHWVFVQTGLSSTLDKADSTISRICRFKIVMTKLACDVSQVVGHKKHRHAYSSP